MEDRMVKISTVQEYVEISKSKIYEDMKQGLFPENHTVGGSALWFMSDIQTYILAQKALAQKALKNKKVA